MKRPPLRQAGVFGITFKEGFSASLNSRNSPDKQAALAAIARRFPIIVTHVFGIGEYPNSKRGT